MKIRTKCFWQYKTVKTV